MTFVYLVIFGVLGVFLRYGQTLGVQDLLGKGFPWATLSINVLGSFLMGFLFFFTLEQGRMSPELRAGILIGGLGAYTTFSTFSMETLLLIQRGEIGKAFLYALGSVVLSLGGTFIGVTLARVVR